MVLVLCKADSSSFTQRKKDVRKKWRTFCSIYAMPILSTAYLSQIITHHKVTNERCGGKEECGVTRCG